MHTEYQTFVCVVERGTISDAAAFLHTTQPTVTRQIQHLERTLGAYLFDRAGKRLHLTETGRRVYQYAKDMLRTEARMLDELAGLNDPERGIIRIGAGLTPTIYRLPAIVAAYRIAHPGVRFQVVTGSSRVTVERLQNRVVDIAIVTTTPQEMKPYNCLEMWSDALWVVVSAKHPLAGQSVSMEEFVRWPMILMHGESGLRQLVEERMNGFTIRGQAGTLDEQESESRLVVAMETDSLEAMSRFVQAGLGTAVLPYSAVKDDIDSGRLMRVEIEDVNFGQRMISAMTRKNAVLTAATDRFVQRLPDLIQAVE